MSAPALPVNYQQLFRTLPDNLLLMAPDATIIDNSDSHVAVSFKPRHEVVGRTLFEAYPSVDKNEGDVIFNSHESVRRTLQPDVMPLLRYDLERPQEQGGGFEEFYWQATHYPILDDAGRLQYILQRTQNVTEQYQAAQRAAQVQRALEEATNRTQFILQSLPVMVWTNRPDGTADYFNPRWLDFTGKTQAELQTSDWADIIHPEDGVGLAERWQQALAQGQEFQHEYRLRRRDGQYRWLLIRTAPRKNEAGDITMWIGTATDIQDQKTLVEELLETNEQQASLSEQAYVNYQDALAQRETYHSLFMQVPAMVCILRGPEHRFEFVNPVCQQVLPHRQLVGLPMAEALPELSSQGIIALLDQVYQTGETFHGNEVKMELERDASGVLRDTYFNFIYQQFREHGEVAGIMVFAFDVTDYVLARQALGKNS